MINPDYETTGELHSLVCARDSFRDDLIIVYGDLLFRGYILNDLVDTDGDFVVVVDSALPESPISGAPDYAYCSREDDRSMFRQDVELKYISERQQLDITKPSGRWIGMLKTSSQGRRWLGDALDDLQQRADFNRLTMPDLLNHLIDQGKTVKVHYINGHWLDVNTLADIDRASDFARGRT